MESNPLNVNLFQAIFDPLDYDLEIANDGDEVFQKATSSNYFCVFLAIDLIDDPASIIEKLTANDNQLSVIGLTNSKSDEEIEAFKTKGLSECFTYPVNADSIKSVLNALTSIAQEEEGDKKYVEAESNNEELPLLDPDMLNSIRALGDPGEDDFLNDLIDLFIARAPEILKEIEEAFNANDAYKFERSSHSLKGSCGNIGALSMRFLCEKMECMGRDKNIEKGGEALTKLKSLYVVVKKELNEKWRSS